MLDAQTESERGEDPFDLIFFDPKTRYRLNSFRSKVRRPDFDGIRIDINRVFRRHAAGHLANQRDAAIEGVQDTVRIRATLETMRRLSVEAEQLRRATPPRGLRVSTHKH